ncbi:hypothetical protein SCALM49S_00688 [Streptomyces californicus]
MTAPVATGIAPGPRVLVVAVGPRGASLPTPLPGDPDLGNGEPALRSPTLVRLYLVAASHSDALLKTLLTARPPWHIRQVAAMGPPEPSRTVRPAGSAEGPTSPGPGGSVRATGSAQADREARDTVTALLRYQAALLARFQRWLAPLLLYAAVLAVGVQGGQPVLGSLGVAAAALLPVTAWAVHLCVGQEPPAARTVVSAAVGARRVHLASLLTGTGCAAALAVVSTAVVLLVSAPVTDDGAHEVARSSAALAGLLASLLLCTAGRGRGRAEHTSRGGTPGLVRRGGRTRVAPRAGGRGLPLRGTRSRIWSPDRGPGRFISPSCRCSPRWPSPLPWRTSCAEQPPGAGE